MTRTGDGGERDTMRTVEEDDTLKILLWREICLELGVTFL